MKYWLMKSEPESFSIDDLAKAPKKTTCWDGVRNYQARNFMRAMELGDQVFFYHSSADPPCIAGIAEIVKKAYPDHTALDPKDHHYDRKATPSNPVWTSNWFVNSTHRSRSTIFAMLQAWRRWSCCAEDRGSPCNP